LGAPKLLARNDKVVSLYYVLVAVGRVRAGSAVAVALKIQAQHEMSNQDIQTTIWVGGARIMIRVVGPRRRDAEFVAADLSASLRHTPLRMPPESGFTIVELLAVIVIILLVSAVALPTVLPALRRRQLSEAERLLQAALIGARDQAIRNGRPSGIRLLPDPAYPIQWTAIGTIDTSIILAYNRWVPLEPAPDYKDGRCTPVPPAAVAMSSGWPCPINGGLVFAWTHAPLPQLVLVQSPVDPTTGLPNAPACWFWNIRVGDRIQLGGAGAWYTVVGPMIIGPGQGNTEMFVNAGLPGPISKLPVPSINGQPVEYLTLVNSQDDNTNGWIDEEFDGIDNDGNGLVDDLQEWEWECWRGDVISQGVVDVPYTIQRRPAPAANGREVVLPTSVVIDATSALLSQERSRLPVNPYTGYVDVMLQPDGTVLPTIVYSTPSSSGMGNAFYHFWLAERADLAAATPGASAPPVLPVAPQDGVGPAQYVGPQLQGAYGLVTLFTRTGQIVENEGMPFDDPALAAASERPFNVNIPFLPSQEGAAGS
jgi:prepilin-type N-terminal cleavage/methylation domain-containing protein